jgi:hypothetical protein
LPFRAHPAAQEFRRLDCGEEGRRPLHLVQHNPVGQIAHESYGVGERGGKLHVIIEGHISVSGCVADHTRQGRLAALARAVDQHDRCVRQRLGKARFDVAGV